MAPVRRYIGTNGNPYVTFQGMDRFRNTAYAYVYIEEEYDTSTLSSRIRISRINLSLYPHYNGTACSKTDLYRPYNYAESWIKIDGDLVFHCSADNTYGVNMQYSPSHSTYGEYSGTVAPYSVNYPTESNIYSSGWIDCGTYRGSKSIAIEVAFSWAATGTYPYDTTDGIWYSPNNSDYALAPNYNPVYVSLYTMPTTVQVNYNKNDNLGTVINMPANGTINIGGKISSTKPTKQYIVTFNPNGGVCNTNSLTANVSFSSWNTNASGTGTTYAAGATYNGTTTLNLYAIWSTTIPSVTLPTPTRSGYKFLGWATSATGTSGVTGSYKPDRSITLYAIWQRQGAVHIYTSDGDYKSFMVWIYNGDGGGPNSNGWHLAAPKIYCTASGVTGFHTCG